MNIKMRAFRDTIGQMAMIFIIASVIGYASAMMTVQMFTYIVVAIAVGVIGYLMYAWNLSSLEMKEKLGSKNE